MQRWALSTRGEAIERQRVPLYHMSPHRLPTRRRLDVFIIARLSIIATEGLINVSKDMTDVCLTGANRLINQKR